MHHEMDATATRAFCCSLMRIKGPTECNARVCRREESKRENEKREKRKGNPSSEKEDLSGKHILQGPERERGKK